MHHDKSVNTDSHGLPRLNFLYTGGCAIEPAASGDLHVMYRQPLTLARRQPFQHPRVMGVRVQDAPDFVRPFGRFAATLESAPKTLHHWNINNKTSR